MEEKQNPRKPRVTFLPSTSKDTKVENQNVNIIGFPKRKVKPNQNDGPLSKKQKIDPIPESLELPSTIPDANLTGFYRSKLSKSPIKTYGKKKEINLTGKSQKSQFSSSEVSKIFGNERDSLIGTSLLEISTEEQNPSSKKTETPEVSPITIKENALQPKEEDFQKNLPQNIKLTISQEMDSKIETKTQSISLEPEDQNITQNEPDALAKNKTEEDTNVSRPKTPNNQETSPQSSSGLVENSPDSSKNLYVPNQTSIFSSPKLSGKTKLSRKELKKLDKEEKIVEIQSGKGKIKVIVEETRKKEYGINWNKYIDENISGKNAEEFLQRKRRELAFSLQESTEPTDNQENPTDEINKETEDQVKKPKIPPTKKKRYGKREPQPQKEDIKQEEDKNTVETYKNDVINQIQINIEIDVKTPEKKINRNKVLLKFFQEQKLTVRMMNRVKFILKAVKEDKIIMDTFKLIKSIREYELEEGIKTCVDRKSIKRLLTKLSEYGLVKYRTATLKSNQNEEKHIQFICDPNYTDDESIISIILEESKVKFFLMPKDNDGEGENDGEVQEVGLAQEEGASVLKEKPDSKDQNLFKFNRAMSKKYGNCPKFARCRKMHELLFYLVYENNLEESLTDPHVIENIFERYGGSKNIFEDCSQAPIYTREVCWKMFLPPLRTYQGYPKGWVMLGDILLRLPIAIFTSCANICYEIPGLEELLAHPIKKHMLIQNIPKYIQKGILYAKKLTPWLIELLRMMCFLGLVQFGPQKFRDRDQILIYLNQNVILLNTVRSSMGYHQISEGNYKKMEYFFETSLDLEQFWYDMWSICTNTPLGHRNAVAGEYIILENPLTKAELIESFNPRLPEEAPKLDIGYIPGDKRGAAGFDSCLFSHLKRNWSWLNSINTITEDFNFPQRVIKKSEITPDKVVTKNATKASVETQIKTEILDQRCDTTSEIIPPETMECSSKKNNKPLPKKEEIKKKVEIPRFKIKAKQKIREIVPIRPKKKKLREEYDEVDKLCLSRMRKLRTDWSELEDHIILLCNIASQYLCPNHRKQCLEPSIFRDVLHKLVPSACDKTSRSVHRRAKYILKHPSTSNSFIMCLEEIKHCEFVEENFGKIVQKYQGTSIPIELLKIAFVDLVAFLNLKFIKIHAKKGVIFTIPDTIQEIKSKYNIVRQDKKGTLITLTQTKFADVENVLDIESDTVRSVIHSSLCSSKDKTSWAFQLFKIYQQYPESLLRSVISKIRTDQLASTKKTAMLKIRSSTSSILQSPFKLSIKYLLLLQNSPFRYQGLMEANSFIQNLISWLTHIDSSESKSYDITCSDLGTSLILENLIQNFELEALFEHPEQVIILDPILKVDTTFERILNKYHDIIKAQTNLVIDTKALSDSDEENIPHINPETQMLSGNSEIKNPSRIGFHMMRAELMDNNDKKSIQHMHDYFVVQASKVFLKPTDVEKVLKWDETFKKRTLEIVSGIKSQIVIPDYIQGISLFDEIKNHFSNLDLVLEDMEYVEKVRCVIHNSGELGLTLPEIKNINPDSKKVNLTYKNVIEVFEKYRIILRVGTTCLRFVHYDFKKPWVTHADKILRLEKEKMAKDLIPTKWKGKHILKSDLQERKNHSKDRKIKILVAPWVRLDGSLNRRVLDRWLGRFVSACVEKPGIKLQDLIVKMYLLKPVETIFLINQLVKIGCVKLIKVKKPKITLFSEVVNYDIEETDILEDPNEILIEPTKDAFFNFAAFVGNKNYHTNFID